MRFLRNNRFALASMDGKTWRESNSWFSKLISLEKPVFADIPYWISASFHVRPWLFLMWAFRLLILALLEPHTGQQNGFSPVCILMCIISFCFEMNFLLHWSHWCSQDSCLKRVICENKKEKESFVSIISSQLVSIALTQGASSRRGKVRYASDVPFHKCHNTTVSSQCEASGGQTHEKCFFCFSFTWWSSKVSLCLVEKSHPCSEQVNLFGWRWTYLR